MLKRLSTKRLLKIAIDVSLQAASVLDAPPAGACSGSLGRRNGTIAIDGQRSRDRSRPDYPYRVEALVALPPLRPPAARRAGIAFLSH